MSAPTRIGPGEGMEADDLLAAEFILGTLPQAERAAARTRIASDPAFAERLAEWEGMFAPLNVEYVPAPTPPDLLPRIERRLFGTPGRVQGRHFVRMIGILMAGVAAALALFLFTLAQTDSLRPPPPHYAATLEHRGRALTFAADWNAGTQDLELTRTSGPAAAPGQVYQLWRLPRDGAPVPLGLVRGHSATVHAPDMVPGAELGLSLEPYSGAAAARPSGPMLIRGILAKL